MRYLTIIATFFLTIAAILAAIVGILSAQPFLGACVSLALFALASLCLVWADHADIWSARWVRDRQRKQIKALMLAQAKANYRHAKAMSRFNA